MRVRRVAKMSLEDWTEDGKEVWPGMQPCRRADASCRRRTIGFAQADTFLFSSFVLTGVDETKATANGISGGVEKVATYAKRRVGRHQPNFLDRNLN